MASFSTAFILLPRRESRCGRGGNKRAVDRLKTYNLGSGVLARALDQKPLFSREWMSTPSGMFAGVASREEQWWSRKKCRYAGVGVRMRGRVQLERSGSGSGSQANRVDPRSWASGHRAGKQAGISYTARPCRPGDSNRTSQIKPSG